MVLTILVLIHRCFFAKNREPEQATDSPDSVGSEAQGSYLNRSEDNEGGEHLSLQTFSRQTDIQRFHPNWVRTSGNRLSDFRLDFAVVAVCRFSSSLFAPPISKIGESKENWLEMTTEDKFRAAVRVIHSLPKDGPYQPANSTKLKFYGLYKQATEGRNRTTQPRFWDVVGRAKWEAWNKLGDMSKDEAMNHYVDGLKEIVETMSFNGDVEDFLDSIGPFYEFVTLQGDEMNHIKGKIDEMSSSAGSSAVNSLQASTNNSKSNSPLKELPAIESSQGPEEEEEEEEVSTSETAEVSVETSSALYETKAGKAYSNLNGSAFKNLNGQRHVTYDDDPEVSNTPPPAPTHSYAHQNGYLKNGTPPNIQDDDEVLQVSTAPYIPCKEDLERDIDEEPRSNGVGHHQKVKVTSSIETVATSGTESEKYYSGDSEPEMDEKYMPPSFTVSSTNGEPYPSTSAAALQLQQQLPGNNRYQNSSSLKEMGNPNSPLKKVKSPRLSNSNMNTSPVAICRNDADLAVHQTVERLNRDVDHILARLRILEAAYASNAEGIRNPTGHAASDSRRKKFHIFGDLSPQSIAFIVMWPFVVQFLIKLLRWWWRRRRFASTTMHSLNR